MRAKVNMAFQVDDESGNTTERCSIDLYINCLKEPDLSAAKEGITTICDTMKQMINNV